MFVSILSAAQFLISTQVLDWIPLSQSFHAVQLHDEMQVPWAGLYVQLWVSEGLTALGFVQVVSINVQVLVLYPLCGHTSGCQMLQDHADEVQVPGGFVFPLFVWVVEANNLSKTLATIV